MLVSHGFVLCVSVVILLLLFFIARYLLYNIVLVSAIHQHESATVSFKHLKIRHL